jgi:4-diphosphocytidyl-2-C-methyl-D-erythritol kinase
VVLVEPAPAKVNLFLRVLGRGADGYHALDSLAVFAAIGDRLEAAPAEALSLAFAGPFAEALAQDGAENLVLRAARALAGGGARMVLHKHLPLASGIGGGSADAAAALRLLARLWRQNAALAPLAAALGADVPVCLASLPARMGGTGATLAPAPRLPPLGLALVNPGVPLATGAVFAARAGAFSPPATLPEGWDDAGAMARDLAALGNDLQPAAARLCPPIMEVLAALRAQPGCLLAQLSGSGATCFALFAAPAGAQAAAAALPAHWWRWGGALWSAPDGGAPA